MKICVIGLGYIGLPTALLLSKDHMVYGCDINPQTVEKINQKILPFNEPEMEALLKKSTMQASLNPSLPMFFSFVCRLPLIKKLKWQILVL